MAEWLRRGLQILARRFDSGSGLHLYFRSALLPGRERLFDRASGRFQSFDEGSGRSLQRDRLVQQLAGGGSGHDLLTMYDYLWRWDTDWFWCSRAFGAQHPVVRRFWPRRYRRSSFYWKLIGYDQRFNIADRLEKRQGRPPRERVVQDVEVPIERCKDFIEWFLTNVPIEPIWLCPLRLRDREGWPFYPILPAVFVLTCAYLFYSSVTYARSQNAGFVALAVMASGAVALLAMRRSAHRSAVGGITHKSTPSCPSFTYSSAGQSRPMSKS